MPHVSPSATARVRCSAASASSEFIRDLAGDLRSHGSALDRRREYLVCRQGGAEAGLKVALSGIGGDELLAGYPSFIDIPRWHRRFGPLAENTGTWRRALASTLLRVATPDLVRRRPKVSACSSYRALGRSLSFAAKSVPTARTRAMSWTPIWRRKVCGGSIRCYVLELALEPDPGQRRRTGLRA